MYTSKHSLGGLVIRGDVVADVACGMTRSLQAPHGHPTNLDTSNTACP